MFVIHICNENGERRGDQEFERGRSVIGGEGRKKRE